MNKANNHFRVGELTEPLDKINYSLEKEFGKFEDGRVHFRVVWSEDPNLTEKRWMTHTNEGMELLFPEVREVRKYSHISERYVLERLVPVVGETDLTTKTSYEPAWTFQDRHGNYLSPRYDACKFIVESMFEKMGNKSVHAKYKDPDLDPGHKQEEIMKMEKYLFGDETPMGDALAAKDGISYAGMKTFSEEEKVKTNE